MDGEIIFLPLFPPPPSRKKWQHSPFAHIVSECVYTERERRRSGSGKKKKVGEGFFLSRRPLPYTLTLALSIHSRWERAWKIPRGGGRDSPYGASILTVFAIW